MNKNTTLDELSLTEEELHQYVDEINEEYDNWMNVNIQYTIDKLSDKNKIFLNDFIHIYGEKILYIIYGYLTSDSLLEYDYLAKGGVTELFKKFDNIETLNFIDLLINFKKYDLEYSNEEVNFEQIIEKLQSDVDELKKKLGQSIVINTREFERRYGLSPAQQKSRRGKIKDPLPFICTNGKTIQYNTDEVEKWLENYEKNK